MEKNQHCRSGVLSGSHSYVAGNSAENVSGSGDRVFERQKQFNDLRLVWESEIQISEQAILVAEGTTLIRRWNLLGIRTTFLKHSDGYFLNIRTLKHFSHS